MTARRPANAGSFYPADPVVLGDLVDELLDEASVSLPPLQPRTVLGVLVPHAGFAFSGPTAASGWAAIRLVSPATIVLLGADHAGASPGIAVWTDGPWRGPLAETEVDHALAERVVALGPPFCRSDAVHVEEHSIEVQLPFAARTCPKARIVPMLVGSRCSTVAEAAGSWLGHLVAGLRAEGERVVIVASSDLAHYPPIDVARDVDRRMLDPILRLDAAALMVAEEDAVRSSGGAVGCGLCGREAVRTAIAAVEEMGGSHGVVLGHATSADRGLGDQLRTVGYASVAFVS
jgi:MEMO1 family protein